MKKLINVLCVLLAAAMLFSLTACGSESAKPASVPTEGTPAESAKKEWIGFHGWMGENWGAKSIDVQFTGYWDMGDPTYNIAFSFLMNLYDDMSVQIYQYANDHTYRYFGDWELVEDPDGDELHIKIAEETNEKNELIDHKYSYEIYEESDGGFSFGFDFGIAAGQYFRVVNMTGSRNVHYKTFDDFKKAADEGAFVVAASTEETQATDDNTASADPVGYTCPVALGENGMTATLTLDDETDATLVAAVTFKCTYTKSGFTVVLEPVGELEGYQAQIWPAVPHVYVLNDEDMSMKGASAAYKAGDLLLVTFADGTMRVEFPQYSMARDGFAYELSEDGKTLTVTAIPDAEVMGAFQQIWDGLGSTEWVIDGNNATKV